MSVLKVRGDGVSWQAIDDELIVLDEQQSKYLRLVGAGATLWPLLLEGTTDDDLAAALVAAYGIEADRANADVQAFVADLVANELLEPST